MIFIDTSALYAVLDRDDENHAAARVAWIALLEGEETLLVTNYVLVETTAIVQHRLGMDAVRALFGEVLPAMEMHWVTAADHLNAQNALLATERRKLSLVDCSSFHIMRSRLVQSAFAFDVHFREQGFEILPAPTVGGGEARPGE